MIIFLIIDLIIAILAIKFVFENTAPVTINFFFWQFTGPLGLLALSILVVGIIMGLLILIPYIIKIKLTISRERRKIIGQKIDSQLEEEIKQSPDQE